MNKLSFLTNQFLKLSQENIDPKIFLNNLYAELSRLQTIYDSSEKNKFFEKNKSDPLFFKNKGYLKLQYQGQIYHEAISIILTIINKKYARYTYPDKFDQAGELDSIYVGINNLINFLIDKMEKIKKDFQSLKKPIEVSENT